VREKVRRERVEIAGLVLDEEYGRAQGQVPQHREPVGRLDGGGGGGGGRSRDPASLTSTASAASSGCHTWTPPLPHVSALPLLLTSTASAARPPLPPAHHPSCLSLPLSLASLLAEWHRAGHGTVQASSACLGCFCGPSTPGGPSVVCAVLSGTVVLP